MDLTAKNVRKRILKMANACGRNAHIGGSLSMVDLLTVLYRDVLKYDFSNPASEDRDIFILSKGHCVLALDAVLRECGVINEEEEATFLQDGSKFGSHPVMYVEHGIESSSGSLGQGVSMAVGLAKAAKIKNTGKKIYTLIGNGECDEGSVWEAVMLSAQWQLDNLTIILDNNGIQSDGPSDNIISMSNMAERFAAFGMKAIEIDGHDEDAILKAFNADTDGKPKVIVANTVKGKGISFMEGDNSWHHNRLTDSLYEKALAEIE